MLSVDRMPRQELLMQTGGSSVTREVQSFTNWNILIASFLPLLVLQQDTEPLYRNDLSMDVAHRRLLR